MGLPDLNEAFLMEHLWHAIFGQPLIMPPQRADETCAVARCGKYCPNPATPELGMFGTRAMCGVGVPKRSRNYELFSTS